MPCSIAPSPAQARASISDIAGENLTGQAQGLSDTLAESLGKDAILSTDHLADYAVDGIIPGLAVAPADVDGVSAVLSLAAREGKRVAPRGGGTQMSLGNVPTGFDVALALGRLDRLLFHEPADLVASVEAGITLDALQKKLAAKGQFLPLEAPLPSRATIGGILAANASGPARLVYGTPRDWLIGARVVHSDGVVTRSGGRVVKNVTGYDLNKLYIGSLGTLAVFVEATLKVAPLPQDRTALVATYPSMPAAIDSAQQLLRQSFTPHGVQVINGEIMRRLPELDIMGDEGAAVIALFAGRTTAVKRKVDDSAGVMRTGGPKAVETLSGAKSGTLWQSLTDLGWAAEWSPHLALKVSILPSQVGDFLGMADSLGGPGLVQGLVADVGWGQVRSLWWEDEGPGGTVEGLEEVIAGAREAARHYAGHVVVERCPIDIKGKIDIWGDPLESLGLMRRIKTELDPAGILNPGRYAGRI